MTIVRELKLRYGRKKEILHCPIQGSGDVASYCFKALKAHDLPEEHIWALMLNAHNEGIGHVLLGKGGTAATACEPATVFRSVLMANAVHFILVHNHPSGRTVPSPDDDRLTARILQLSKDLNVPLLDHVIVGNDPSQGIYSYADEDRL